MVRGGATVFYIGPEGDPDVVVTIEGKVTFVRKFVDKKVYEAFYLDALETGTLTSHDIDEAYRIHEQEMKALLSIVDIVGYQQKKHVEEDWFFTKYYWRPKWVASGAR